MLTIEQIKQTVTGISQKYGVKSAYLFGSYARGEATAHSDVDLLVDKGEIHTYRDYFHFCEELEQALGTPVDVLPTESMRPGFFDLIKRDRVPLYEA